MLHTVFVSKTYEHPVAVRYLNEEVSSWIETTQTDVSNSQAPNHISYCGVNRLLLLLLLLSWLWLLCWFALFPCNLVFVFPSKWQHCASSSFQVLKGIGAQRWTGGVQPPDTRSKHAWVSRQESFFVYFFCGWGIDGDEWTLMRFSNLAAQNLQNDWTWNFV